MDAILERTRKYKHRPLLNVPKAKEKIQDLLEQRQKYYQRADYAIDTTDLTSQSVADIIIEKIQSLEKEQGLNQPLLV